ncbi:hypothetical protein REPUB_Repub06bG0112500 [Reevesia pubescens]
MDMWDIIMDGPFIPTKKSKANEVVPKSKSEWTADDKAKVKVNFKAINTLHCALNLAKFNRISTCNNAKEIHHVLFIKGLKYNLLSISQLCDKGYRVIFDSLVCQVVDTN